MVTIACDVITNELLHVAKTISERQKDVVKIITPTDVLEVHHEKERTLHKEEKESQPRESKPAEP